MSDAGTGASRAPKPTVPLDALPLTQVTPTLEPAELSELDAPDFSDVFGDGPPPEVVADPSPAEEPEDEPDPRRPRHRRRYVSGFFVAVVVLALVALLALAADGLVRLEAERTIAGQLHRQLGNDARVAVSIEGTPFVTQLASHDFPHSRLKVTNARIAGLDVPSLNATATELKTSPDNKTGTIDRLSGDALITYASIGAKQNVGLDYVSPTALKATLTTKVFGRSVKVYVTGRPELDAGAQTILLKDLHTEVENIGGLPDFITREAAKVLLHPIAIPLPAGLKVSAIELRPEGLDATFAGDHVDLAALK